jgi:membrane protease YdiL (CAAX protease family)
MPPKRRGAVPFFCLAFASTWGLQIPGLLAQRGILPGNPQAYLPFAGLGLLGPLAAATLLAWREDGRAGVRSLYAPLARWRVHPGWWLTALVPCLLLSGFLLLLNLAGRQGPIAYLPSAGMVVFGVLASIGEEVGWRGYALPKLQERWSAFAAGSLIGVMWCFWHIPMFIGQGVPLSLLLVMLLYFVGASLFMTWSYNATGKSLLLASFVHFGAHLNNSHRALPGETLPLVVHAVVFGALGLFVMQALVRSPAHRVARSSS